MKVCVVTGSREWSDVEAIRRDLEALPDGSIVIHGACPCRRCGRCMSCKCSAPRSADTIAHHIALNRGLQVIAIAAPWAVYGNRAGHIRNGWLVSLQTVLAAGCNGEGCGFAYPLPEGSGTQDCIKKLRAAGVEPDVWGEP